MVKIINVAGARPNFMKATPIIGVSYNPKAEIVKEVVKTTILNKGK